MLVVNDVFGMQIRFKAKNLVVIHAELGQPILGNAALLENRLHILLGDHQRFRHLGLLVHGDPLADLVVDSLHHIQAAFLPQGGGQQGFKGLFLLSSRLGCRGVKYRFNEGILPHLHIVGIVQGIVDIGGAVVKGREQEAQHGSRYHLVHGTIVEDLFLRHIMQIGFGLLHRADGADQIGVGFVAVVTLAEIILALKGNVIAVTANQDQVSPLHAHRVNDLLIEGSQQLLILQLALPQIHQQLVLRGICHLRGFEGNINEILSQRAGQGAAQQGKIFVGFILRHHTGGLTEGGDDLLVVIDIAAVQGGDIAPLPAQMAANFADFLINHRENLVFVRFMPVYYSTYFRKNPVQKGRRAGWLSLVCQKASQSLPTVVGK